jgi:hypothetical protein
MQDHGRISAWKDDKGYGFTKPDGMLKPATVLVLIFQ